MAPISQMRTEEFCTRCGRGLTAEVAEAGEAGERTGRTDLLFRLVRFQNDVADELARAREKHADFPTAHHGLSVIHEEFCELQALVYRQREERTADEMRAEAVQIAAMAARFAMEICDPEIPQ